MICRFAKIIFQNKENGFCVFVYHTEDDTVPVAARDSYYKERTLHLPPWEIISPTRTAWRWICRENG